MLKHNEWAREIGQTVRSIAISFAFRVLEPVSHRPQQVHRRLLHREHRRQVIQQLASEALQLKQVDEVLFVHAGMVAGRVGRCQRRISAEIDEKQLARGFAPTPDVATLSGLQGADE